MLRVPNAGADPVDGAPGRDTVAVHSQLARVLASPHFRNSKRSQALLRFVVESVLSGDLNSLKERCVGAAVFGRDLAYDTAQDPIVRNAAVEVRKRLAQYYLDPEHTGELRIELPIGSYVPAITIEAPPPAAGTPGIAELSRVAEQPEPPARTRLPHDARKWALASISLVLVVAAALFFYWGRRTPSSELDSFWEPLFRDRKTIQVCIGQPSRLYRFTGPRTEELNRTLGRAGTHDRDVAKLSIAPSELTWVAPEYLFMRDALSAFTVASWIQSKGRPYQLMSVANTNYAQIRRTPLVVIGAFNNPWAMRVNAELRFVFDRRTIDGTLYNCIIDRREERTANWKVKQPLGSPLAEDFAIVTKVFDAATEKTVIAAAGIETYGTLAAGEFVTQAEYLGAALQAAPQDWRARNVQFVLGTKIIDGTPGPPRVLASHFW